MLEPVLKLDKGTISRRLKAAESLGYLVKQDGWTGNSVFYRVGDPMPHGGSVLPEVARLRQVAGRLQGERATENALHFKG